MDISITSTFWRFSKLISEVVPGSVRYAFLPFVAVIVLISLFKSTR